MVIREYEIEEDGLTYLVREYDTGAVVKTLKDEGEVPEYERDFMGEKEQRELEMAANIEYLVLLAELNEEV